MIDEKKPSADIILKNVRIAFADGLFVAKAFEGKEDGEKSYGSTFLVEKGSDNDKLIQSAIKAACAKTFEKKADAIWDSIKGTKDCCYRSGDLKDYDGFAGKMALSAKRQEKKGSVLVLDRDLSKLTVNDGRPYSGCYVNAKVQIWAQTGKYTGVRCTLVSVQFVKDGDAFGGGGPATADGFEEVVDEESADDLAG